LPDQDPAYHFDADPDPAFKFAADPDPQHCLQISQMTKILINAIMLGTVVAIGIVYFLDLHEELPS
jgi:hypothetical protein